MSLSVSFSYLKDKGLTSSDPHKSNVTIREPLSAREDLYSPTEMLLMAMGGCSTSDILVILNKMHKTIDGLDVRVEGERVDIEPKVLKKAHFIYSINTNATEEQVLRAINLSLERYCSVTILARKGGTEVFYSLELNGKMIKQNQSPSID